MSGLRFEASPEGKEIQLIIREEYGVILQILINGMKLAILKI